MTAIRTPEVREVVECLRDPEVPSVPLVLDSPHSGRFYPRDFHVQVSREQLRRLEDGFVDELLLDAPALGATLVRALFPRSYIDPNRAEHDLDTSMVRGHWPHPVQPSHKCELGVGLIFRRTLEGEPIYGEPLSVHAVQRRISRYHRPYHEALAAALERAHGAHGLVWHLNCHSMPSHGAGQVLKGTRRADFCLGNRHGASCSMELTALVAATLRDLGYHVTLNDPYAGVELVRRYAEPSAGRHSLQIEVNRALYMDEAAHRPHAGLATLRQDMRKLFERLAAELRPSTPLAAE